MPFLGRLFPKKNRIPARTDSIEDDNSPHFAPTTTVSNESHNTVFSYVTPDISVPSHPNAKSLLHVGQSLEQPSMTSFTSGKGNGGRFRLFRRKKSTNPISGLTSPSSDVDRSTELDTPQTSILFRLSDLTTDPTDLRRPRPPPSRSAIFAAYADPGGALSTRSLPENASTLLSPVSPPPLPSKRPSLFAWAKQSSRSSSNTGSNADISLGTPSESSELPTDAQSFNLKSFRHVGSASPPPASPRDDPPSSPIPRLRGISLHSDSSQRISVSAFREVQARRSLAGSPVHNDTQATSSPLPSKPVKSEGPQPRRRQVSRSSAQNSRGQMSINVASTTDEDDSSSDTDSDEEAAYNKKVVLRSGRKAQSELGHSSMITETSFKGQNAVRPAPRVSRSHVGHGNSSTSRPLSISENESQRTQLPPRPRSSLGLYEISANTAVTPSASKNYLNSVGVVEQKRPVLARSTVRKVSPPQNLISQQPTKVSVHPPPRDSDSDSEDNTPLASFMVPKRPGSAASSLSNPRSVSGHTRLAGQIKPLIDVNEVISSKPTSVISPSSSDAAFTQGPTLLSANANKSHGSPLSLIANLDDDNNPPLASKVPPLKTVTPLSSPKKGMRELVIPIHSGTIEENLEFPTSDRAQRESSPEHQRRDPLSDRLSRVVRKSLTNPINSGSTPSPAFKPLAGVANRLSSATLSESLQTRQLNEAARITLPRSPPPISNDEYSPPDEDLAQLLGTAGIKLISRTGNPDESSSSESSEDEDEDQRNVDRIAPIPIKQITPPPAFAVTSRPSRSSLSKKREHSLESSLSEVKSLPRETERKSTATVRSLDVPANGQRSSTLPPLSSRPFTNSANVSNFLMSPSATDILSRNTNSNGRTEFSPTAVDEITNIRTVLGVRQKIPAEVTLSSMSRHSDASERRFTTVRGNSPSSSTGDSSSGREPYTPRDSEVCAPEGRGQRRPSTTKTEERIGDTPSVVVKRQNAKRRSVSFDDDIRVVNISPNKNHVREPAVSGLDAIGSGGNRLRNGARVSERGVLRDGVEKERVRERQKDKAEDRREKDKEDKRRERRRSEAQAAIELGNVIHGPPPILDDDNNDLPPNPIMNRRLPAFNPMMAMNPMNMAMHYAPSPGPGGWVPSMVHPNLSPAQFMIPPPSDPNLMGAHQQAMMVAKQAYQMAVAQQAMAAAAEEWERGSALGGLGSGGSYTGTAPSMVSGPASMGMMPGMQINSMWPGSSHYGGMGPVPRFGGFLSSADMQFSSSRSEHGGIAVGSRVSGNWSSSKSMYGESFGPLNENPSRKTSRQPTKEKNWNTGRESTLVPSVPLIPASKNQESRGPSRLRTSSQPATPTRSTFVRKAMPPSSWRPAGS